MPNYCLYAELDQATKDLVSELTIKDEHVLLWSIDEATHITVFYRPTIPHGVAEVQSAEEIETVFPGARDLLTQKKFTISKIGIFVRPDGDVITLQLESPELTDVHKHFRTSTVNPTKAQVESVEDGSWGTIDAPPSNWCHITLGNVSKDVDVHALIVDLEAKLDASGLRNTVHEISGWTLISAITDTRIPIVTYESS
jgi:hypothetical protein